VKFILYLQKPLVSFRDISCAYPSESPAVGPAMGMA